MRIFFFFCRNPLPIYDICRWMYGWTTWRRWWTTARRHSPTPPSSGSGTSPTTSTSRDQIWNYFLQIITQSYRSLIIVPLDRQLLKSVKTKHVMCILLYSRVYLRNLYKVPVQHGHVYLVGFYQDCNGYPVKLLTNDANFEWANFFQNLKTFSLSIKSEWNSDQKY